jgi:PAS domain S-box-containing protein
MDPVTPLHILVIEDDADTRANLRDILKLDDHRVESAGTAAEALAREDWSRVSAVILDRKLPDATADELLPRIRREAPESDVIVVTGYADLQGAVSALRQGAIDYILKPISPDELRGRIRRIAEGRQAGLDRKRAEEELRQAEERFRLLVQNSSDIITALAGDGTVLYQSPSIERLLGHRPADRVGRNIFPDPIAHPEDLARKRAFLDEAIRRPGVPVTTEFRLRHVDGTWRHIEAVGQNLLADPSVGAIVANYRDITERRRAEERAIRAERLAAIGQMVAGLAHESRNALQRSQACLEILALEVRDRPKALGLIDRLQKAQDNLHHLYEDVRGYAAPVRMERRQCDLAAIWREAWAHPERERTGRSASFRERLCEPEIPCLADPFRLGQVFHNTFENALAACPDPALIEVSCTPTEIDGRAAVRVTLRDNGPGLGPEDRQRIFEPFYTTKTKGTGLGMAISRRIVEAHGGRIAVGEAATPGAEIVITLPRGEPRRRRCAKPSPTTNPTCGITSVPSCPRWATRSPRPSRAGSWSTSAGPRAPTW